MPDRAADELADELYALAPEDFTVARDAAARGAGKELKAALKAMRRPTVGAWVVNRLAREQAELLEQLLQLGPALAEAQASGRGDDLRALDRQRRELVQEITAAAVGAAGREVTTAVRAEVEQTLEAGLADPAAADAVRSGTLVRPLSFAGFGGVDVEGAVAVPRPASPGRRATPKPAPQPASDTRDRAAKRARRVAAAERTALDAAAALDDAVRRCEDAQTRQSEVQRELEAAEQEQAAARGRVEELDRQLATARAEQSATDRRVRTAQEEGTRAEAATDRATRRVQREQEAAEQARAKLDALRRQP